ncbi:MAG TPA: endolytic transglycosylase MltG [Thermomicrobiales bacterium]|nr:endolytic transglycosylase MltG [Thermomicrobiales bacterium]
MVQWLVQILKIATILVLSGLVLLGGARAFEHFQDESRPDDIGKVFSIKISEDDTPDEVAKLLEDNGLINSKTYFTGRMRVVNSELEPGSYRLTKGMTVGDIIDTITGNASSSGDSGESGGSSADNAALSITVIEGWRTEQIADELVNLGWNGTFDDFMQAAQSYPSDNYAFLADRPEGASLEGYLFPDTYNFDPDSSADEIIESMLNNFDAKVPQEMRDRAGEMGLSLYQVLTFASLVEREAAVSEERPIIADIYEKRYTEGWRLEADPTVQYALGTHDEWWPELSGEDLYDDSPYNTYQVDGLPPGPIANPGYASIRAVLFPQPTDYYYFYAKADDSGYHLFATTSDEQQQNIDFVEGKVDAPAAGSDPFAGE